MTIRSLIKIMSLSNFNLLLSTICKYFSEIINMSFLLAIVFGVYSFSSSISISNLIII